MSYTYLSLCNDVLRRINEVEIPSAEFSSVRGIQSLAKDAVQDTLDRINHQEFEWPWNHTHVTQALTPGQVDYNFGDNIKIPEWDSFLLVSEDGSVVDPLSFMPREKWYTQGRAADIQAGNLGRGQPQYVFQNSDRGFGVTPSPNGAYSVRFEAYEKRQELVLPGDVPRVPFEFRHVIVSGALYHLYMFKDNTEQAAFTDQQFRDGVKNMQTLYINQFPHIYPTRKIG
jgi:hypothetical protein